MLVLRGAVCLSVARIDTPPLQPVALAFVSYGLVLVGVRVRGRWVFLILVACCYRDLSLCR